MGEEYDEAYWEDHWRETHLGSPTAEVAPNPHLVDGIETLIAGSALDAGYGEGAEAIWLSSLGWRVTAVDISHGVLERAAARADALPSVAPVRWVAADLGVWEPEGPFDLVTTHYAHPTIPQLDFYGRIAEWVAPGGTLLIVGHGHPPGAAPDQPGHDHGAHADPCGHGAVPSAHVTVTATDIVDRLAPARWDVVAAGAVARTVTHRTGRTVVLHDVVVLAVRHT